MIRSRKSYIFIPTGEEELPLTFPGTILADPGYVREWQGGGGSAAVYGSPFGVVRADGGRVLRVSWTQYLRFQHQAAAELAMHAREIWLNQHPEGIMRELYAYQGEVPCGSYLYRAALENYTPQPPTPESYLGRAVDPAWARYFASLSPDGLDQEGWAWRAVEVSFLLTPIGNEP